MVHSLPKPDSGKSSQEVDFTYHRWTCPRLFELTEVVTAAKRGVSYPYLSYLHLQHHSHFDDCEQNQLPNLEKTWPQHENRRENWSFFVALSSPLWLDKVSELLLLLLFPSEPLSFSTAHRLSGLLSSHLTSSWDWGSYCPKRRKLQQKKSYS